MPGGAIGQYSRSTRAGEKASERESNLVEGAQSFAKDVNASFQLILRHFPSPRFPALLSGKRNRSLW
jgi:hypothetical protein